MPDNAHETIAVVDIVGVAQQAIATGVHGTGILAAKLAEAKHVARSVLHAGEDAFGA